MYSIIGSLQRGYIGIYIYIGVYKGIWGLGRVHVLNNWVLRVWATVSTVLISGKYMVIRYLDP